MLLSGVNLLMINLFTFTVTGFKHKNKLISIHCNIVWPFIIVAENCDKHLISLCNLLTALVKDV